MHVHAPHDEYLPTRQELMVRRTQREGRLATQSQPGEPPQVELLLNTGRGMLTDSGQVTGFLPKGR